MTRKLARSPKSCKYCKKEYQATPYQVYCSKVCRRSGHYNTPDQYLRISGNWDKFLQRLLYRKGREDLTVSILLDKLNEQDYKCALSGEPLTCKLEKGIKTPTNVSIDRIQAGGSYTADNIQLVCRALNSWRADLPVQDFVQWCRLVANHADQDKEGTHHA